MATYAEYLKSQGATEDEIKLLDTPTARRAFERMEAALVSASDGKKKAEQRAADLDKWYNEDAHPAYKRMEAALLKARADNGRLTQIVSTATEQGLFDPKDFGLEVVGDVEDKNKNKNVPLDFDPSKYLTQEDAQGVFSRAGETFARLQNLVLQHIQLFPNQPLDVEALRQRAIAAKTDVITLWKQEWKVDEVIAKKAKDAQEAHDAAIRAEERKKVEAEMVGKYGDPHVRPHVDSMSTSILAPRPKDGRDKQPWETGTDGENGSSSRVARALRAQLESERRPN